MKQKSHIPIKAGIPWLILVLTALPGVAQNLSFQEDVSFTIRYFDKVIYYPETPIMVKAEIRNNSPEDYRFRITDSRVFNFEFQVYTLGNQKLEPAQDFTTKRRTNQPIFFREVLLGPGEEYGFVINLKNYVKITEPGTYYVDGRFFPHIAATTQPVGPSLSSNRLTLSVRPSQGQRDFDTMMAEERQETLQRLDLAPDEVVQHTLEALQKKSMDEFFLYLDVESLLLQDAGRERRFRQLSQENRQREIKHYKEDIMEGRKEYTLMERPIHFEILRTNYTPREGTVLVQAEFQYQDIIEIKEYTYHLENKENIWYITRYEVQNLGSR